MDKTKLINDIFAEHERALNYKQGLCENGLFEQSRINERFFDGDQWHGVFVNPKRPLISHNLIRRIGEYKLAAILNKKYDVQFLAEGADVDGNMLSNADLLSGLNDFNDDCDENEAVLMMKALGVYYENAKHKFGFEGAVRDALKNAYVCGTGALFMYWDKDIKTGLFADSLRKTQILGDVQCKCIDIECVDFGDVFERDVQKQPYIILSERISVDDIKAEARANGCGEDEINCICADNDSHYFAGFSQDEDLDEKKATVLTKMFKRRGENGVVVRAIRVCRGLVIKDEFDLRIREYPICIFRWQDRRNCVYGESEITALVPNQIAINRMLTASVWATMLSGMPMMLVNSDLIKDGVSNEPGQIMSFSGDSDDFERAIKYVEPPRFAENFVDSIKMMIDDTLEISGATKSALGLYEMNNASAIEYLQKASNAPIELMISKYEQFLADAARIFVEFFVCCYGVRKIKIADSFGIHYLPFDSKRYKDLVICIDVLQKKEDLNERE